jgi:hypothetical protein
MTLSLLVSFLLSHAVDPDPAPPSIHDGIPDWERTPVERLALRERREADLGSIFLPR